MAEPSRGATTKAIVSLGRRRLHQLHGRAAAVRIEQLLRLGCHAVERKAAHGLAAVRHLLRSLRLRRGAERMQQAGGALRKRA